MDISVREQRHEQKIYPAEKYVTSKSYDMAGFYSLAKADEWEALLEAAGRIVQDEQIPINFEIKDFDGVAKLCLEMARHFGASGKRVEAQMCLKVVEHIKAINSF
jgi:hypothetical protein